MLAIDIGTADKTTEILVTINILTQQHQTVWLVAITRILNPDICTNDRFNALCNRGLIEFYNGEKISQVGNGHGRHTHAGGSMHKLLDTDNTVLQGKFRVHMQMNEVLFHNPITPKIRLHSKDQEFYILLFYMMFCSGQKQRLNQQDLMCLATGPKLRRWMDKIP